LKAGLSVTEKYIILILESITYNNVKSKQLYVTCEGINPIPTPEQMVSSAQIHKYKYSYKLCSNWIIAAALQLQR